MKVIAMGKNNYIQKRDEDRQKFFNAGCDVTAQKMFDLLCLVLNDPETMDKDTFGASRLKKIHNALAEKEEQFWQAWCGTNESDYYQEKLDSELRRIFGNDAPKFAERYPYLKEFDYIKGKFR